MGHSMAYLRIDYSQLDNAANSAQRVADRLNSYAIGIQNDLVNKASNVTGGQNGNMTSVVAMATYKANAIRQKAAKYEQLKSRLNNLRINAEDVDNNVANKLRADQRGYEQNLSWFERILVHVHEFINGVVGESEFGRFLNNIGGGVRLIEQFKANALGIVHDFFAHGKGRYIVNIAIGVTAAIAAIVACVGTGGIVAIAAVIAAVVAVGVAAVTIIDNAIALSTTEDNPGYAKHMGNTDSLQSFAEKHVFKKSFQNIGKALDIVGHIASAVRDIGGVFKNTKEISKIKNGIKVKKEKTVYEFKKDVVKKNLLEKLGFVSTDELNPSSVLKMEDKVKNKHAVEKIINEKKYYLSPKSFFEKAYGFKSRPETQSMDWGKKTRVMRFASGVEYVNDNIKSGIEEARSLRKMADGESDAKSTIQYAFKHIPAINELYSIYDH